MSEWPDWMELPWEFWSDKELNRWLEMYRKYAECQRLKWAMREERQSQLITNKETKFPRTSYSKPTITKQDIDDWIQRCIEDFPEIHAEHSMSPTHDFNEWFEKWFSQFRDGCQKRVQLIG